MVTGEYNPEEVAVIEGDNKEYPIGFEFEGSDSITVFVFDLYAERVELVRDEEFEVVKDNISGSFSVKVYEKPNFQYLLIVRNTPTTQNMDTSNGFPLNRELVEKGLDKITLMVQDIDFYARRSTPEISINQDIEEKICKLVYVDKYGYTLESENLWGVSLTSLGDFATAPESPNLSDFYYNTTTRESYVWNGTTWALLSKDGISLNSRGNLAEAPADPALNDFYYDTTTLESYVYNGAEWVIIAKDGATGPQGIQGETGPQGIQGETGPQGIQGVSIDFKGSLATAPESPEENWAYYNTVSMKSYIYDGSAWVVIAQGSALTISSETMVDGQSIDLFTEKTFIHVDVSVNDANITIGLLDHEGQEVGVYPSGKGEVRIVGDGLENAIATERTIFRGEVVNGKLLEVRTRDPFFSENESSYGLRWNATTDSYTKLRDAEGLSVDNAISPHISDFSDQYPWKNIKRCNLANDLSVNAFYGDAEYTDDGSNGEVMVQIPKFYYRTKFYIDGNGHKIREWNISEFPLSGYKLHPAFINNGIEKDYFYISAYEGYNSGGTLKSIAGQQPTTDQTIATFRTQAQQHGDGWGIQDFSSVSAIQLLYLIEYGDMFSQSVLSEGVTTLESGTGNHSQNTGHTASLGNLSGEVTILEANLENGATGGDTHSFSYRGIENFYGNIWKFTDGILIKDDGYYLGVDIDNYNDAAMNYLRHNTSPITTDGYSTDFENLDDMGFAFMPNAIGGSTTTYTTDHFWAHNTGQSNIALFGTAWYYAALAGGFCWNLLNVASCVERIVGARLLVK